MQPKFALSLISCPDFTLNISPDFQIEGKIDDAGNIKTETEFAYNPDIKTIRCQISLSYSDRIGEFMKLKVWCFYGIDNFGEVVSQNDESFDISLEFKRILFSITVGVARGIQFAKTEGTPLSRVILPILDAATHLPG